MVKINFFSLLRLDLGIESVDIDIKDSIKLIDILKIAERKINKSFMEQLTKQNGDIYSTTMILLNGKNVHHLNGLNTIVNDGDNIDIFPPGGGG